MSNADKLPAILYSTYGTDPDMRELVELFVDEMPERINGLLTDFESDNLPELGRRAHQIKGAAGSYGFNQVTSYAARLEAAVRDQRTLADIRESLDDLVELCRRARAGGPQ